MKKIVVLHVPESALLKMGIVCVVNNIWTLFSYSPDKGFFDAAKVCMYICVEGKDEEQFNEKYSALESAFPNEIKQTYTL